MRTLRPVTKSNAALALFVAIAADGAQLLLNTPLALFFGVGTEIVDAAIDAATALIVAGLLGFDKLLIPTFILELVPLVDDLPTWTAVVSYLIWKRRKEGVAV